MLRWKLWMRLLLFFASLATGCAPAIAPWQASGEAELGQGEGLLILHVDSDVPLAAIESNRGSAAHSVARGHHVWLVRAAAGEYRWTAVRFPSEAGRAEKLLLKRAQEFRFQVEAGAINYPGALIVRSHPVERSAGFVRVRNRNHAAMALRMLRARHASVLDRYPLRYGGRSGDTFLEHYSRLRALEAAEPR